MEIQLDKVYDSDKVSGFRLRDTSNAISFKKLLEDTQARCSEYEEKYGSGTLDKSTIGGLMIVLEHDISCIAKATGIDSKIDVKLGDIKEDGSLPVSINILPVQQKIHVSFFVKEDKSYRLIKRYNFMKKKGKMRCVY